MTCDLTWFMPLEITKSVLQTAHRAKAKIHFKKTCFEESALVWLIIGEQCEYFWHCVCIFTIFLLLRNAFFCLFYLCLTCFPKWRRTLDREKWDKDSSKAFQKHLQVTALQLRILLHMHSSRVKGRKEKLPNIQCLFQMKLPNCAWKVSFRDAESEVTDVSTTFCCLDVIFGISS